MGIIPSEVYKTIKIFGILNKAIKKLKTPNVQ